MNWQKAWDMKKIELVLQPNQFTSFTSYYLEEYWQRFFDISVYDPDKTYDRNGTVFVFWWMNNQDDLPKKLKDLGYRVAIDHLWEYPQQRNDFYWIEHLDWFRLNESLWWRAMNYHRYSPINKYKCPPYRALVAVNRIKPFRDIFFDRLEPWLDQCIWSYDGKNLPNDVDRSFPEWQRFMNPLWYDAAFCSVIVETGIDTVWTTEKSFKPMAFYHPSIFLSAPGHLSKMKSLGFETFSNIIDETYDEIKDYQDRCQAIIDIVSNLELGEYSSETQRRMQHNHDHFFDKTLVESVMTREIVEPLLEYAAT